MKKLLGIIGGFFSGLFNAAKRTYNKLDPATQVALIQGSGIVAVINEMIDNAPDTILQVLQVRYPELDVVKMKSALIEAAFAVGVDIEGEAEELVDRIKIRLQEAKLISGERWARTSSFAASAISHFLAPNQTKLAVIIFLIEWVYRNFIKKEK